MNSLTGTITHIQSHEGISLVKVKTDNGIIFTSMVLDTTETADYLTNGNVVKIIFKETEVIIAKDAVLNISVQNQLPCVIQSIKMGVLLSQVTLLFGETTVKSIITTNACNQLHLKKQDAVVALIKTNEISLSAND
jgi:molybdate transport system regulatory protein